MHMQCMHAGPHPLRHGDGLVRDADALEARRLLELEEDAQRTCQTLDAEEVVPAHTSVRGGKRTRVKGRGRHEEA